jgi:hypothetical protein
MWGFGGGYGGVEGGLRISEIRTTNGMLEQQYAVLLLPAFPGSGKLQKEHTLRAGLPKTTQPGIPALVGSQYWHTPNKTTAAVLSILLGNKH